MLIICCLYCIYTSLKLDVVFILENKMFVMSSKLYLIEKKFSLFYFTYVENLPHGTSSDFAFLNWDERCLGNCSIDTSRYIVFMHSSNSCHPKCTNTIQTFNIFLGVHDGEIELWTNGWKRGGGGFAFLKMKNESTCNGYDNWFGAKFSQNSLHSHPSHHQVLSSTLRFSIYLLSPAFQHRS